MSEHDNDTCPHLVRASLLESENARLKAEVERWKGNHAVVIEDRNTVLSSLVNMKAEVERLRASSFVTAVPVEQYERLINAGDALAEELIGRYFGNRLVTDWNAAKEVKPSV